MTDQPRGGDPVIARRRIARQLDDLAQVTRDGTPERITGADWWLDIGMTLGVRERDQLGAVHPYLAVAA